MSGVIHTSIDAFLDRLASREATPGGGSAAAIMGAMGAALVSMVCNVSFGKKGCESAEAELRQLLAECESLRKRLADMVALDIRAFDGLLAAYRQPKSTEEEKAKRSVAIQTNLKRATEVPLDCVRTCASVIRFAHRASELGYREVVSDGGVGVLAAHAAARSAALNVFINAPALKDRAFADAAVAEVERLLTDCAVQAEAVYQLVRGRLKGGA